jgi:hypothetical protein
VLHASRRNAASTLGLLSPASLMKIIIAIFVLIANTSIYSQVMYHHNIVKQYDSLYKASSRVKKTFPIIEKIPQVIMVLLLSH